jgi:hypothetical protein
MGDGGASVGAVIAGVLLAAVIIAILRSYKSTRADPKWRLVCGFITRAERALAVFERELPESRPK